MFQKIKDVLANENISLRPIYGKLGGRTFIIISFFSVTGFILAWHGKLNDAYAALATAVSGFHVWRARGEDHHDST